MHETERRRQEEMRDVLSRHAEVVSGLKQLHREELDAIKARSREGAGLEVLTNQLQKTAGALRLLEQQMGPRGRDSEVLREGQMEARERLISEMESQALRRAEAAEAEG